MGKIIKFPFKKNIAPTTQNALKADKPSLDEQFYNISRQSHMHLQEGSLGLYACDLYSMSEINRKEKMYDKQLHLLTLSAYTHLSGIDTLDEYTYWKNGDFSIVEPNPLLPPAIIRSLRLCIKRLNMSIDEYRNFYVDTITPTLTPAHVFGVRKTLDIICAYMEGDIEKADKMVANGTKKFIKEHSSKRR